MTEKWAHIVVGISFVFRSRNYQFWTDSLPFNWYAFNGSNYAELNGTISLVKGAFGSLDFILHYRLEWNSSYILIEPMLSANLKYPISNAKLFLKFENISVNGDAGNDFCAFHFNNQTYEYFFPSDFAHSVINVSESLNHLFIYDNATWKLVDFSWDWNHTLNGFSTPTGLSINGYQTFLQLNFTFGDLPNKFILQQRFWWHDPIEIRYMRSDQHTVNGLTAYILGLTQSNIAKFYQLSDYGRLAVYTGIRVWKRNVDGNETEITGGSPVAVAYRSASGSGLVSATWICPLTSLELTDAVVVRVYMRLGVSGVWSLASEFITEQLGATQLDNVTWTVYYWLELSIIKDPELGYISSGIFRWGTSTYNSRIENFAWSIPLQRVWHDIDSISFNAQTRKWSDVQTETVTVTVKQWNFIELFTFNLLTRQWNNLQTAIVNLTVKQWRDLQTLIYTILTKKWNFIDLLTFNLVSGIVKLWRNLQNIIFNVLTKQWSILDSLAFTINLTQKYPLAIIAGAGFLTIIIIVMLKKRGL